MKHYTVFREDGVYAGWPANHGAWQWGNELLVGFIRGKYGKTRMHNVVGPLEKVQARSLDGGETWAVEIPNRDFEAIEPVAPPSFSLSNVIIRVCGNYDHGGELCAQQGGFYLSHDRGYSWHGSFDFKGLEKVFTGQEHNTSRTCVRDDLIYLSAARRDHWGSDYVFCATHNGREFEFQSVVCNDRSRAVMPAAASIGSMTVVAVRRRGPPRPGCWIDAFVNTDGRHSWWAGPYHIAETGIHNGNPPALVATQDKFYCAYANRTERTVELVSSEDGEHWYGEALIRKGKNSDIGYPRLFWRPDGALVCVYYWAEDSLDHQHIEATVLPL